MLKGLNWTEFSKNVCQVPGDWAKNFFLLIPATIIIKKKLSERPPLRFWQSVNRKV